MAERVGFEPTEDRSSRALQARAFGRTMQPLPIRTWELYHEGTNSSSVAIVLTAQGESGSVGIDSLLLPSLTCGTIWTI